MTHQVLPKSIDHLGESKPAWSALIFQNYSQLSQPLSFYSNLGHHHTAFSEIPGETVLYTGRSANYLQSELMVLVMLTKFRSQGSVIFVEYLFL